MTLAVELLRVKQKVSPYVKAFRIGLQMHLWDFFWLELSLWVWVVHLQRLRHALSER